MEKNKREWKEHFGLEAEIQEDIEKEKDSEKQEAEQEKNRREWKEHFGLEAEIQEDIEKEKDSEKQETEQGKKPGLTLEKIKKASSDFKKGEYLKVKVKRSSGEIEEGWAVSSYNEKTKKVRVYKLEKGKTVTKDVLFEDLKEWNDSEKKEKVSEKQETEQEKNRREWKEYFGLEAEIQEDIEKEQKQSQDSQKKEIKSTLGNIWIFLPLYLIVKYVKWSVEWTVKKLDKSSGGKGGKKSNEASGGKEGKK